jgi:hypothetical protein
MAKHGTQSKDKKARGKGVSAVQKRVTAQKSLSGQSLSFVSAHKTQVEAVMAAAQRGGLLREKTGRIGGRVSPALIRQAKTRTGIKADTDLIEFALANIALEDKFAESFKDVRGKVDPSLDLGF